MSTSAKTEVTESGQATRGRKRKEEEQPQAEQREHISEPTGMRVHTVQAKVPIPYLTPQDVAANVRAIGAKLPGTPGRKALLYGGLGVAALAGVIDWPVAVAIGAATVLARGRKKDEETEKAEERHEQEPRAQAA